MVHDLMLAPQARYLPSPDTELHPTGKKSGIKYSEAFRAYRKLLTTSGKDKSIKAIFAYFDKEVFAGTDKAKQNAGPVEDIDDELAAALAEMTTAEELDEDSEPIDYLTDPDDLNVVANFIGDGANVVDDLAADNHYTGPEQHFIAETGSVRLTAYPGPSNSGGIEGIGEPSGRRTRSRASPAPRESSRIRGKGARGGKKKK